jgi:hypothetical protein
MLANLSNETDPPPFERRKYFKVIVQHSAEVDPIGVIANEAAALEFSGVNGSKSLQHWARVIPV